MNESTCTRDKSADRLADAKQRLGACVRAWESIGIRRPISHSPDAYFVELSVIRSDLAADFHAAARHYAEIRFRNAEIGYAEGGSTSARIDDVCDRLEAAANRLSETGEIVELRRAWNERHSLNATTQLTVDDDASSRNRTWVPKEVVCALAPIKNVEPRIRLRGAIIGCFVAAAIAGVACFQLRDWFEGSNSPIAWWNRLGGSTAEPPPPPPAIEIVAEPIAMDDVAGSGGLPKMLASDDPYSGIHNRIATESWLKLADEYRLVGRCDRADVIYCRLTLLRPDDPEANRRYASFLLQAEEVWYRDSGRALHYAEEAYRIDPKSGSVLDTLVNALYENGHVARAVTLQEKRIASESTDRYPASLSTVSFEAPRRSVIPTL